jgi:hypothetical protein
LKDCGSGAVGLQFIPEKLPMPPAKNSGEKVGQVHSQSQVVSMKAIQDHQAGVPLFQDKKAPVVPQRILEKRQLELINTFTFNEDSIMLKLYDNGVIDGDIISLVINGRIVLNRVKLTATAIEFPLKSSSTNRFLIELFAENLGEIPPNTGLVILSDSSRQDEVVFSSNLQKNSAFWVILQKKE